MRQHTETANSVHVELLPHLQLSLDRTARAHECVTQMNVFTYLQISDIT